MSKVGAQQGEFAAIRSKSGSDLLSIGSKTRFDASLKRQTAQDGDDARPVANQPIGLGTAPEGMISSPPPTYDTAQAVLMRDIEPFLMSGGGSEAESFKTIATGLSSESLPNIVIVGTSNDTGNVAIATVGKNILIPSAIYGQWQERGQADAKSADQFNQAFSNFLTRSDNNAN